MAHGNGTWKALGNPLFGQQSENGKTTRRNRNKILYKARKMFKILND